MSDRDKYLPFEFGNQFFSLVSGKPANCLICNRSMIQNVYHSYQIICTECMHKLYINEIQKSGEVQKSNEIQKDTATVHIIPEGKIHPKINTNRVHTPNALNYPQNCLNSMLFICDFVYQFTDFIKIDSFTLDQLFQSASLAQPDHLYTELCLSFLSRIINIIFKNDSEIQISESSIFLKFSMYVLDIFDIRSIIFDTWPTLIGEVIQDKAFREYIKNTPIEKIKKNMSGGLSFQDYFLFSLDEKIGVIEMLINIYMDTKEFREYISEKIEQQCNLNKICNEKKSRIKQIEGEIVVGPEKALELATEKILLVEEEKKLSQEANKICCRSVPIGMDSENNEYFFFAFETDKVFVMYPSESPSDLSTWYCYDSAESVSRLILKLLPKTKKECKLKTQLEKILESGLTPPIKSGNYINKKSESVYNTDVSIEKIKLMLKELYQQFSKYLANTKKRIDTEPNEKSWKALLRSAQEIAEIRDLFLEFSLKSATPLRLASNSKSQKASYRKVMLKIWQNASEAHDLWEKMLKSLKSKEELMMLVKAFALIIESYMNKKNSEKFKHDEECFKCGESGKLIFCENCPRAVHLKCVGLVIWPSGDWKCDNCE